MRNSGFNLIESDQHMQSRFHNWIRTQWTWFVNEPPSIPIVHHAAQVRLLVGVIVQVQLRIGFGRAVHLRRHGLDQYFSASQHFIVAQFIHLAALLRDKLLGHRRLYALRSGAGLGDSVL